MKRFILLLISIAFFFVVLSAPYPRGCSYLSYVSRTFTEYPPQIPSQLVIKLVDSSERSGGTGFYVVSPKGKVYVMTNAHVCDIGDKSGVMWTDAFEELRSLKILKVSYKVDLCLLAAPDEAKKGIDISKYPAEFLERIFYFGYPGLAPLTVQEGFALEHLEVPLAYPYNKVNCVSAGGEYSQIKDWFGVFNDVCRVSIKARSSSLHVMAGASGSPVVNVYGELVGVIFGGYGGSILSTMVPLEIVKKFISSY